MSVAEQRQRYNDHDGDGWFVVDVENDGEHRFGRVVSGPMDGDSAERATHELNDHCDGYRYVASQKFDADAESDRADEDDDDDAEE